MKFLIAILNIENTRRSLRDLNPAYGRDLPQVYRVQYRVHAVGKYNSGRFHLLLSRATRGRHDREPFSHDHVSRKTRGLYEKHGCASERERKRERRKRIDRQFY